MDYIWLKVNTNYSICSLRLTTASTVLVLSCGGLESFCWVTSLQGTCIISIIACTIQSGWTIMAQHHIDTFKLTLTMTCHWLVFSLALCRRVGVRRAGLVRMYTLCSRFFTPASLMIDHWYWHGALMFLSFRRDQKLVRAAYISLGMLVFHRRVLGALHHKISDLIEYLKTVVRLVLNLDHNFLWYRWSKTFVFCLEGLLSELLTFFGWATHWIPALLLVAAM